MGQIKKTAACIIGPISGIYQRSLLAACIIVLYYRPVFDIRGSIYNSFAGGIIVQVYLV
jgi:hypothetical protein